jgi:hypothetical protein
LEIRPFFSHLTLWPTASLVFPIFEQLDFSEHWSVVAQSKIRVEHLRGHSSLALDSVGPLDSYFPVGNLM